MANETKIDELVINIKSKADSTTHQHIDNLIASLVNLKTGMSDAGPAVNNVKNLGKHLGTLGASLKTINTVGTNATMFTTLGKSLKSLNISEKSLASLTTSTKSLSKLSSQITRFSKSINEFTVSETKLNSIIDTIKKLDGTISGVSNSTQVLSNLSSSIRYLSREVDTLKNKQRRGERQNNSYFAKFTTFISKLFVARQIGRILANAIQEGNNYVETMNLFTVSFGEYADEVDRWAENISGNLGLDPAQMKRYAATYMDLARSLGVTNENAVKISKNFTQLTYDIASLKNLDFETSFLKLRSGLAGEIEPLRAIGYDISNAALQTQLYEMGINRLVTSLSQADKATLRYIVLMKNTATAQADMGKTLMSPANAIRILKSSFIQLSRAIGYVFIPVLQSLLPVVKLMVDTLTWAAEQLAVFLGFEFPEYDDTVLGGITDGLDGIGESAEDAKKKLQNLTLGFDELHTINPTAGADESGLVGNILDNIELPEYDMLSKYAGDTKRALDTIKGAITEFVQTPAMQLFGDIMLGVWEALKRLGEWCLDNPETVANGLFLVATGLLAIGAANLVTSIITGIGTIITGLGWLGSIIGWIYKLVTGIKLGKALKFLFDVGGLPMVLKGVLAFLTDIVAITAIIVGAIWTIKDVFDTISAAINGDWNEMWASLADTARSSAVLIGGIALFMGDILGAVLMAGVYLMFDNFNVVAIGMAYFLKGFLYMCGTVVDAIRGTILTVVDIIYNLFLGVVDILGGVIGGITRILVGFADFFGNIFNDPVSAVITLFENLAQGVLDILKGLASAIDNIFGTNLENAVDNWKTNVTNIGTSMKEKYGNGKYEKSEGAVFLSEISDTLANFTEEIGWERKAIMDNWNNSTGNNAAAWGDIMIDYWKNDYATNGSRSLGDIIRDLKVTESVDKETPTTLDEDTQLALEEMGIESKRSTAELEKLLGAFNTGNDLTQTQTAQNQVGFDTIGTKMSNLWWKMNDVQRACENIKLNVVHNHYYGGGVEERASGGFVSSGDLFLANEAGPEMIGRIGNKTAVANTDQIVESISNGVYSAMMSVMNKQSTRPINVTSKLVVDKRTLATATSQGAIQNGFDGGLSGFDI